MASYPYNTAYTTQSAYPASASSAPSSFNTTGYNAANYSNPFPPQPAADSFNGSTPATSATAPVAPSASGQPAPIVINRNFYYTQPGNAGANENSEENGKRFSWSKFFFSTASVIAGTGVVALAGFMLAKHYLPLSGMRTTLEKMKDTGALFGMISPETIKGTVHWVDKFQKTDSPGKVFGEMWQSFSKKKPVVPSAPSTAATVAEKAKAPSPASFAEQFPGQAEHSMQRPDGSWETIRPKPPEPVEKSAMDDLIGAIFPGQTVESMQANSKRWMAAMNTLADVAETAQKHQVAEKMPGWFNAMDQGANMIRTCNEKDVAGQATYMADVIKDLKENNLHGNLQHLNEFVNDLTQDGQGGVNGLAWRLLSWRK